MSTYVHEVDTPKLRLARLGEVVGEERYHALQLGADETRQRLGGRTIWNVNSTATGGGVAEMLQVLIGYALDGGIDVRWLVIGGTPEFFAVTKRIHNRVHGVAGDGGRLGAEEQAVYRRTLDANLVELRERVRPGDVVLLHDPQTAGLAAGLAASGAHVVWRCHIGAEEGNDCTEEAWAFLRPHLAAATALVFTRQAYVPPFAAPDTTWVIPPSIDPFSPKNHPLGRDVEAAILARIGLVDGGPTPGPEATRFERRDGSVGEVVRAATIVREGPAPALDEPMVVQVSRWDRLKDMVGVLTGFAHHVVPAAAGHLALVGPEVAGVTDDPEGADVLGECVTAWRALPDDARRRISLVTLPVADVDENAAMVNAIQRHAAVVVQKSLAEGFGLTVAEGMWKGRPVVASAVGGIVDQVVPGTGLLLHDPRDGAAFGAAVVRLLTRPDEAAALGVAAHDHVRANFLGDRHLLRYAALVAAVLDAP